ncbi:hypothetical protein [Salinicola acroporae]|uniref:hypothetical protein n=1 Tax=Salinicola acroporae TaxID=1541440 RepID=UPI0024540181
MGSRQPLQHRHRGTLAVGTGNGHHTVRDRALRQAEPLGHDSHPLQPHVDGNRMLALKARQPVVEGGTHGSTDSLT